MSTVVLRRARASGGRVGREVPFAGFQYLLQADYLQAPSYLLGRNQLTLSGAGADLTRLLPALGRGDVALPERPGATLPRPDRVDSAALLPVIEHAVAVELLAQGAPAS